MNDNQSQDSIDLQALKRKEKPAFARLVEQNSEKIYRLALKMVGNEQDAEDVLQETFIKAFNHIEGFEARAKLSTWLYRIAVNESLMLLRKRKKRLVDLNAGFEIESGDVLPQQIVDWCCLPEKELMSEESRRHINQAMQTLSDANRAVFVLRDIEGLSTRETAETLEISESAAKVRLMRARMLLREELTHYFADKIVKENA